MIPHPSRCGTTTKRPGLHEDASSSSAEVRVPTSGTPGRSRSSPARSPRPCEIALSSTCLVTAPDQSAFRLHRHRVDAQTDQTLLASHGRPIRASVKTGRRERSGVPLLTQHPANRGEQPLESSTALRPRSRAAAAVAWPPHRTGEEPPGVTWGGSSGRSPRFVAAPRAARPPQADQRSQRTCERRTPLLHLLARARNREDHASAGKTVLDRPFDELIEELQLGRFEGRRT